MATKHEFLPVGATRQQRTAEQMAAAPTGFDYPTTQVGVNGKVTVAYDPALGQDGLALAQKLLPAVSLPYSDMEAHFGISGGYVTVVIAPLSGNNDGSGGAYHYGCDFVSGGVMYLDATFANAAVNPLDLEVALYVAELSESFMGAQNRGWGCGFSNGEGLSRYCAEQETPPGTIPAEFVTGPAWADAGYKDWVTTTEQTDQNAVSTGCAIVYLYWMRSLGFSDAHIIQAGGDTLAANYQTLTGKATAYQDLIAALKGLAVTSDNPFGLEPAQSIPVSAPPQLTAGSAVFVPGSKRPPHPPSDSLTATGSGFTPSGIVVVHVSNVEGTAHLTVPATKADGKGAIDVFAVTAALAGPLLFHAYDVGSRQWSNTLEVAIQIPPQRKAAGMMSGPKAGDEQK